MKLRKEGKENRLTDGRVIKLNAVGFVWDAKSNKEWKELDQLKKQKQADILWDQHYNSLITYKRVTGAYDSRFLAVSYMLQFYTSIVA